MSTHIGYISQIIGPVVDVYFPTDEKNAAEVLPKIHDALEVSTLVKIPCAQSLWTIQTD